jgi:hypothetical protein
MNNRLMVVAMNGGMGVGACGLHDTLASHNPMSFSMVEQD